MVKEELLAAGTGQRILQNQLATDRLSHAYLFTGESGVGKRRIAASFALAINCPRRTGGCDCDWCLVSTERTHPDIQVVRADGNTIKIEQVRSLIAAATLSPNQGRWRIFVIEEAERLTREAANALLLTLEDPCPHAIFILTASSPVLPTIRSRCQVVQFHRSSETEVGDQLGRADMLALLLRIMQAAPADRTRFAEEIDALDRGLPVFLATILDVLRDLLVQTISGDQELINDRDATTMLRPLFSGSAAELAVSCQLLIDTERMLLANVNRRLLCEHLLLSLR